MSDNLQNILAQLDTSYPSRGFVSTSPAGRWEDGMITGNGTQGALAFSRPYDEEIVLSHEELFLPIYPPVKYMDLPSHMDSMRELVLDGKGREAMVKTIELARAAGYPEEMLTDPFIGACSLRILMDDQEEYSAYARSVDFRTGDALVAWKDKLGLFHRRMFASRTDNIVALQVRSPNGVRINARMRLERIERQFDQANFDKAVADTGTTTEPDSLTYSVAFNRLWETQPLTGYCTGARIVAKGGAAISDGDTVEVKDADELVILIRTEIAYGDREVVPGDLLGRLAELEPDYDRLLSGHAKIHGELFGRAQLRLSDPSDQLVSTEELQGRSSTGNTDPALLEKAFDAGRFGTISSTGKLPPALQGIWTGTWRPNWSGDFTLNGNVQSAVASSLPGNYPECMRATLEYMTSMMDDFCTNARSLFGFRGAFVPWRSSTHGQTHTAGLCKGYNAFPGMYWFAGTAWFAQFYYDYWLYTGDREFLKAHVVPFLLSAAEFYEDYLCIERDGKLVMVPSYSPENGPKDFEPLQPNATMTVAAVKQVLRTLIVMGNELGVDLARVDRWKTMLEKMPPYEVASNGALKEWTWPGLENHEHHRHASHLYPLYDGVDPEIAQSPELIEACRTAIERRLHFRREENGGIMAFGLTQLGLAASNLRNADLAYECVEWLTNSYWSPAMVSTHDPHRILNLDISGGLVAVVINMLLQSTAPENAGDPWKMSILPALPGQWQDGSLKGARCRGGFGVALSWRKGELEKVTIESLRGELCLVEYNGESRELSLAAGEKCSLNASLEEEV